MSTAKSTEMKNPCPFLTRLGTNACGSKECPDGLVDECTEYLRSLNDNPYRGVPVNQPNDEGCLKCAGWYTFGSAPCRDCSGHDCWKPLTDEMQGFLRSEERRKEKQPVVFAGIMKEVGAYARDLTEDMDRNLSWFEAVRNRVALAEAMFEDYKAERTFDGPKYFQNVSVYKVERCYGGPEEGGWWYDWSTLVDAKRVVLIGTEMYPEVKIEAAVAGLKAKYAELQPKHDRYSMANEGPDYVVMLEDYVGEHQSTERPHYE